MPATIFTCYEVGRVLGPTRVVENCPRNAQMLVGSHCFFLESPFLCLPKVFPRKGAFQLLDGQKFLPLRIILFAARRITRSISAPLLPLNSFNTSLSSISN